MNEGKSNTYINDMEISFENMCHSMQINYPARSVKSLSVQEFYSLVEMLEQKNKPRSK